MRFVVGKEELQKRSKNIKIGAFFAGLLVIFIVYHNNEYPEKYNDVLYWSIMGFIILSNLVGYYRYRRYLRMVKQHWIEVHPEQLEFHTNDEVSKLNINDIAALNLYRHKGTLQHIQIKLKNNRGVRLEGYEDINALGDLLCAQVPKAHISGNK
ncbi:MAG: hypothetical protein KZQ57_11890 [gamma proteobacterium symbiont of Lucinoma myriamae]|nr:hypothetical protein [gamma proteobacterium symbiont of Lucinoma myriamae]